MEIEQMVEALLEIEDDLKNADRIWIEKIQNSAEENASRRGLITYSERQSEVIEDIYERYSG